MGRSSCQAAAEQQTAQQLIQQLLTENERLKAALQRSSTANEHGTVYTTGSAAPSSLDAAPFNSELLRSPGCAALQTPLGPQQQQQVLGNLLTRLQQGFEPDDDGKSQLAGVRPSCLGQQGSCKPAATQQPTHQSVIPVWQPSHPALAPFQVAFDRHPVHPSTFLREASPGGTSSTCITNNTIDNTPPAAQQDVPSVVLLSAVCSQPHPLPAAAPKASNEPASPAAAVDTVPLCAMQPSSPARPAAVPEVATPTARMPATTSGKESRSLGVKPAITKQQKKRNKKRHKKVKQQPASHSTLHPPSPSNGKPSNSSSTPSGCKRKKKGLSAPAGSPMSQLGAVSECSEQLELLCAGGCLAVAPPPSPPSAPEQRSQRKQQQQQQAEDAGQLSQRQAGLAEESSSRGSVWDRLEGGRGRWLQQV